MKKVILVVLTVLILIIAAFLTWVLYGKEATRNMTIGEINLSTVSDGTYSGQYKKGRFTYSVDTIVKDHKISDIKVLDDGPIDFGKVNSEIIGKVKDKQSLEVDVVSGASVTSKALLKAIENSLKSDKVD
jgi:uncharacterized protein with FMN-binding domain